MKAMINFLLILALILPSSVSFAEEGEIILGEYEPVTGTEQQAEKKDEKKVERKEIHKEKEVRSPVDDSIDQIIRGFEKELGREIRSEIKKLVKEKLNQLLIREETQVSSEKTLDQEIDEELIALFKEFRAELKAGLKAELRKRIVALLAKHAKTMKVSTEQGTEKVKESGSEKTKAIPKSERKTKKPKVAKATKKPKVKGRAKHRIKKLAKTKKSVRKQAQVRGGKTDIRTILVGNDKLKKKLVVGNGKSLPIIVTVVGPTRENAVLKLYAKNIAEKEAKLIYELNPFRTNYDWGQDQLLWDGTYIADGKKQELANGQYQIFATLTYVSPKTKKEVSVTRFWGLAKKGYVVHVGGPSEEKKEKAVDKTEKPKEAPKPKG